MGLNLPRILPRTLVRAALLIGLAGLLASPAQAYKLDDRFGIAAELLTGWTDSEVDPNGGFRTGRAQLSLGYTPSEADRVVITLEQNGDTGGQALRSFYWQHQAAPDVIARAGIQPTPMVDYDESRLWKHRFVAPTFSEFWQVTPVADNGVSIYGLTPGGGMDYQLMYANGEGYGNPVDATGNALSAHFSLHDGGWTMGAFFYTEESHGGVTGHDPERQLYFLGLTMGQLSLSGQYLLADDGGPGFVFDDGEGYNVQGHLALANGTLFGRYDKVKPTPASKQTLTVVGYTTTIGMVDIAPNYRVRDFGGDNEQVFGVHAQVRF